MRALFVHLNDQQVGTLSEGEDLWSFDLALLEAVAPRRRLAAQAARGLSGQGALRSRQDLSEDYPLHLLRN